MTDYTAYWGATCLRGVIALVAGAAIVFLSALNSTVLLMSFGMLCAVLVLATYVVADSAIVVASSFMLPRHHLGRAALRFQGIAGMLIGITCFIVGQGESDLKWFLYLAALQAACVAIAEYLSARSTVQYHRSNWCYAAAVIAALSSVTLIVFHQATGHLLSWLLYGYLWCFGLNQFVLSCHMLFEELHVSRTRVPNAASR